MTKKETPKTYAENFETLKQIAEELENEKNPDVDLLIEKVKIGLKSHEFCSQRITSATEELQKILKDTDTPQDK